MNEIEAPPDAPWMCSGCAKHVAVCICEPEKEPTLTTEERAYAAAVAEARVFEDHLRGLGVERVTLFHVRCLESFFAAREPLRLHGVLIHEGNRERDTRLVNAGNRLRSDLAHMTGLDELQVQAQWEDTRRLAEEKMRTRRERQRAGRARLVTQFFPVRVRQRGVNFGNPNLVMMEHDEEGMKHQVTVLLSCEHRVFVLEREPGGVGSYRCGVCSITVPAPRLNEPQQQVLGEWPCRHEHFAIVDAETICSACGVGLCLRTTGPAAPHDFEQVAFEEVPLAHMDGTTPRRTMRCRDCGLEEVREGDLAP